MDTNFKVLEKIVKASGERQKVIASNIANADTPGYKAKDISFGNFLKKELKMKATSSNHIQQSDEARLHSQLTVKSSPSWGDKNNVELNVEVAKMAENALTHNAAIKLLNSKISMYKKALNTN